MSACPESVKVKIIVVSFKSLFSILFKLQQFNSLSRCSISIVKFRSNIIYLFYGIEILISIVYNSKSNQMIFIILMSKL